MNQFSDRFGLQTFIHPTAVIGECVNIWHFSVVLADVTIGHNVSIGTGCEIGRGTTIGDFTRIGHGVFLPPNSKIGSNVFIGPSVTMTDDRRPVVNNHNYHAEPPVIQDDVSIGAGCVILPGVTIFKGARIGAGSVVTRDVPPNSLVYGEKATVRVENDYAKMGDM